MNLRQYLAASGAASLVWLLGQSGSLLLIPIFAVLAKLPASPFLINFVAETSYWVFQGGLAFLATLIATNLLPLPAQMLNCWIFAMTGFMLAIWLRVAFFRHFERHPHKHGIIFDTVTDPFVFYFFVGAFFCVLYVFLRKPVEPLITLR